MNNVTADYEAYLDLVLDGLNETATAWLDIDWSEPDVADIYASSTF